ncbi:MAG TPA: diaminopimelate epimerase, partial [Phenylobacterium sp.]|nr:diaminopimelate epimerase [Phenylobacterium sp.]
SAPFEPSAEAVRAIADRATGVGCDQLIVIEPPSPEKRGEGVDARVRFWNSDGEEIGACGNGTRCVGWLLMQASGKDHAVMESRAGLLVASRAGERLVSVDMGKPGLDWTQIPLAHEQDTRALDVKLSDDPALATSPGSVSMGNPHVVFFVDDLDAAPVATAGPAIEHHPLFPEAVNVGFAQVLSRDRIRLRVWERGAGLTKACGTGACAALVAAVRRDLTDRSAVVVTDGGELLIEWRAEDDHVIMTGPAAVDFAGELP